MPCITRTERRSVLSAGGKSPVADAGFYAASPAEEQSTENCRRQLAPQQVTWPVERRRDVSARSRPTVERLIETPQCNHFNTFNIADYRTSRSAVCNCSKWLACKRTLTRQSISPPSGKMKKTRTWNYFSTNTQFLTLLTPAVLNCGCSKGPAPCWSNSPFLIFDIRALWRSVLSARAPECLKLKVVGRPVWQSVKP